MRTRTMTENNHWAGGRRGGLVGALALVLGATLLGCGPTFDAASLIKTTRVLGARVEVEGVAETPSRASPMAGETAAVTWLVESPGATPALGWAFALCAPGDTSRSLSCAGAPFALYQGTENPPRITITVPAAADLDGATSLLLYGRVCVGSAPTFDPVSGLPGCTDGGPGTTATTIIPVGGPTVANHNPTADHGFTFDGVTWPATVAGDDPCTAGPRVTAGTDKHVIGIATAGADRERYTVLFGDPPVETPEREGLQVSQFATAGKFKAGYSFVEGSDAAEDAVAEAKWDAPEAKDVGGDMPVLFTFVARDGRGGTDWTTRAACVGPQR